MTAGRLTRHSEENRDIVVFLKKINITNEKIIMLKNAIFFIELLLIEIFFKSDVGFTMLIKIWLCRGRKNAMKFKSI